MGKELLYFYCIKEKVDDSPFYGKGVDGERDVFCLPYHELEAVVSKVTSEEFDSEEVQKRAQEDINWIKEKAIIHEKVIEEAMKKNGEIVNVIPMKFGTVFKEEKSLKETLDKHYEQFKSALEKLKGKQEWSLKVYLSDKEEFERVIKEKNDAIKEKVKEIADLPEGMAFFMEEELREAISKETESELNKITDSLFKNLSKQSVGSVKNKILEKELTGKSDKMILNVAYLIPHEKVEDFKRDAKSINQEIQKKGFYLEYNGPWPAYNFSL